jgi:hypothetical protein
MNSGGSLEVKNGIISIGTTDSRKSASVPESVQDQKNGGSLPSSILATNFPESLRVSNKTPEANEMDSL